MSNWEQFFLELGIYLASVVIVGAVTCHQYSHDRRCREGDGRTACDGTGDRDVATEGGDNAAGADGRFPGMGAHGVS